MLGQPLDGEPVGAGDQRGEREFAGVDWAVVLYEGHRFGGLAVAWGHTAGLVARGATKPLLRLVGLVWTRSWRVHDRASPAPSGLSWCWHAQVRPCFCPYAGRGSGCLALVAIKPDDVPGCGLLFAQSQAQPDPFDLAGGLVPSARVAGRRQRKFFRNALDSCERLMRTPSRAPISARRRGIVQLRPVGHGFLQQGRDHPQRRFTLHWGGPGATLAVSAAMTASANSLRQETNRIMAHTECLGDRGLVQPDSVSSTVHVLSASPIARVGQCRQRSASVAVSRDFSQCLAPANWSRYRISAQTLVNQPKSV
jgi:hypothetical protein